MVKDDIVELKSSTFDLVSFNNENLLSETGELNSAVNALMPSATNKNAIIHSGTYTSLTLTCITCATTPTPAIATILTSNTAVTSVTVTTPGSGYSVGDKIKITGSDIGREFDLVFILERNAVEAYCKAQPFCLTEAKTTSISSYIYIIIITAKLLKIVAIIRYIL